MHTRVNGQGVDVGREGLEEGVAEPWLLLLVERVPGAKVRQRRRTDSDLYDCSRRNFRFASSQSSEASLPSAMR